MIDIIKLRNQDILIKGLTLPYSWILFFCLFIISICISYFLKIPILGRWEMLTFFHNFSSIENPLTFRIGGGFISSQGIALLDISRYVSDKLSWSLNIIRTPSILAGWISLCVFFIIAKRISGFLPALLTVLFLSVNETFSFFQNQLIVVIITFAFCLIIIERIQAIDANTKNKTAIIFLGVSTAFLGINYGMGRFFALFLITFFIFKFYYLYYKTLGLQSAVKELGSFFPLFIFSLLITFIILSPYNLLDLINIKNFFFGISDINEIESNPSELLTTLSTNLKIYFNNLFYLDNEYQTKNSYGLIASARTTLISPIFIPFVILGMIISIKHFRIINYGINAPYGFIHAIFIITVLPPLFSELISNESTLSTYRMFNILIPVYLYGAVGIHTLIFKFLKFKKYIISFILFLLIVQTSILCIDRLKFIKKIDNHDSQKSFFNKSLFNGKKGDFKALGFVEDEIRFRKYASKIASTPLTNKVQIFSVDLNEMLELSQEPFGEHIFGKRNFFSTFISLYTSDVGKSISFVQAYGKNNILKLSGTGYRGKKRIFPAEMTFNMEKIVYKSPEDLQFKLRITGPKKTQAYLTTTNEEKQWLINYLKSKKVIYEIILIDLKK